jgi:hypothetical protein
MGQYPIESGIAGALREAMAAAGIPDRTPSSKEREESITRRARSEREQRARDREHRAAEREKWGPLRPGFRWLRKSDPSPTRWWAMDGYVKLKWWCFMVPDGMAKKQIIEWLEEQCVRDKYWSNEFDVSEMRVRVEARRNEAALKARRAARKLPKKAAAKPKKAAKKASRKRSP